jgi:hypothetical protein
MFDGKRKLEAAGRQHPPTLIGLARLTKMAFDGASLAPLRSMLVKRVHENPGDAAAFLDLSFIAHLQGRSNLQQILQAHALELERVYRKPPETTTGDPIRLLAFVAPGDFMANMPVEFMIEGASISLEIVYLRGEQLIPQSLPEHDVALVAVSESSKNRSLLRALGPIARAWPRPVVNAPDRIARLSRDGTWALLRSAPDIAIPKSARIDRVHLDDIARATLSVETVLDGSGFPIIARPLDSHSGEGLAKLDDPSAVADFLRVRNEGEFYIAPFVDYRSRDGLYRKYRIALIEGRPYACHMAISQHWMIHYFNAEMTTRADRRAEEAHFIATFDEAFAVRHARALRSIAERVGLDYVPVDCGEIGDGRLVVFEVGTNMIVHAMDSPDLFPYKRPQMEKTFRAFHTMLRKASRRAPGIAAESLIQQG